MAKENKEQRLPARFACNTVMLLGTFVAAASVGFEAQRVSNGDFCKVSQADYERLGEEKAKDIFPCTTDLSNGAALVVGAVTTIVAGVIKHKKYS